MGWEHPSLLGAPGAGIGERRGKELRSLIHSLLQDQAWPASRNPCARWSRRCQGRAGLPVPFGGEGAPRRPGVEDAPRGEMLAGGAGPCPPRTGCAGAGAEPGRPGKVAGGGG